MKTFQQFAEELEPNQPTFSVSDVGATLRKIEAANEKERGRYTGLLNIVKSRPGMIELFGELINSLAGTTTSTGQRLTNRLQ